MPLWHVAASVKMPLWHVAKGILTEAATCHKGILTEAATCHKGILTEAATGCVDDHRLKWEVSTAACDFFNGALLLLLSRSSFLHHTSQT